MTDTISPQLHYRQGQVEAAVFGKESLSVLDRESFRSLLERKMAERRLLSEWADLPETRVLFLDQVHGFDCVRVTPLDVPASRTEYARADAFFTLERDVCLVIRTADCLPVFFHTEGDEALCGVLHAGWRGLVRGIIQHTMGMVLHTVERSLKMQKGQLDQQNSLHVFPGPYIPGAAYEVGPEVASRFALTKPMAAGKSLLDLYANARWMMADQFRGHTISYDDPFDAVTSALSLRDGFYSHRRGDAGRNLNVIRLTGGTHV